MRYTDQWPGNALSLLHQRTHIQQHKQIDINAGPFHKSRKTQVYLIINAIHPIQYKNTQPKTWRQRDNLIFFSWRTTDIHLQTIVTNWWHAGLPEKLSILAIHCYHKGALVCWLTFHTGDLSAIVQSSPEFNLLSLSARRPAGLNSTE